MRRRPLSETRRYRRIYQARDRADAARRVEHFLTATDHAALPTFSAFADGVRQWRTELLNYFDEPLSNGYAEGTINKIKVIKRRAYGLPTFHGFRQRVLPTCG
jgi:transposase